MQVSYSRLKSGGSPEMPSDKVDFETWVDKILGLSKSLSAAVRLQKSISIKLGWGPKYEQRLEKSFKAMADFENIDAAHIRTEDPIPLSLPESRETIEYTSRDIFAITLSGEPVQVIVKNDGSAPVITYTSTDGKTYIGTTSEPELSIGKPFQMSYRDQEEDRSLPVSELIAMAKQDSVSMHLKVTAEQPSKPRPHRPFGFAVREN